MTAGKSELYRDLAEQLSALLAGEADLIAKGPSRNKRAIWGVIIW